MPRVIAITNFKGGIGKTTTTVNVAAGFAIKGAKVLIVDVDAQNNVQMSLGLPNPRRSLYDVMIHNVRVADCIVPARPNMDLLVAGEALLMGQAELSRRPDWSRVLETSLRPIIREYDFVFIDCSASVTILNTNAMMAASDIIVPTALEHLAIQGVGQICRSIARVKGSMASLRLIVPTMYDTRNRSSQELLSALQEQYGSLMADPIRVNVRLAEAPAHGQTVFEFDPRSRGAVDYAALVERLARIFNFKPSAPSVAATQPPVEQPAMPPPAIDPPTTSQRQVVPLASLPRNTTSNGYTNGYHGSGATQPAEPVPAEANTPLPDPSAFRGQMRELCPHCQRPLEQVMMVGYRVLYCDYCKYKRQELAATRR